jgi:hypothetical protein
MSHSHSPPHRVYGVDFSEAAQADKKMWISYEMSDVASAFVLKTKYGQATWQVVEVLKKADPVRIIRFGSAAWGTLHENSDLDLWVFVELIDQLRRLLDGEKNSGD